jgi:hypothetical protein
MTHSAEEGSVPSSPRPTRRTPEPTEVSTQSHVPISHSPPAPTLFALLAAGQLKTNRQPIPECAL